MATSDWKQRTSAELVLAENARNLGNEGRARVCARRAAGYIAGEYLQRQGIILRTESALEKLRYLETLPALTAAEVEMVQHFLIHITPEHVLPIDADLIEEVHVLANKLLGESLF